MLSNILLFETLLHVNVCVSLLFQGKKVGGFLSQTIVLCIPSPVSCFCTMNFFMVLRMSGSYLGQETYLSFAIHNIIMAIAVNIIVNSACCATVHLTQAWEYKLLCRSGECLQRHKAPTFKNTNWLIYYDFLCEVEGLCGKDLTNAKAGSRECAMKISIM